MFEIIVDKIEENPRVLHIEIDREFKEWFVSTHSLKRWHHMKFRKVLLNSLKSVGIDFSEAKLKVTSKN